MNKLIDSYKILLLCFVFHASSLYAPDFEDNTDPETNQPSSERINNNRLLLEFRDKEFNNRSSSQHSLGEHDRTSSFGYPNSEPSTPVKSVHFEPLKPLDSKFKSMQKLQIEGEILQEDIETLTDDYQTKMLDLGFDESSETLEEEYQQNLTELQDQQKTYAKELPYKVLGLDPDKNYTESDIKKAYRKASLAWHPDKLGSNLSAQESAIAKWAWDQIDQAKDLLLQRYASKNEFAPEKSTAATPSPTKKSSFSNLFSGNKS